MQKLNMPTVTELGNNYLTYCAPTRRDKGLQEEQRLLENTILPALGSLKVESVNQCAIETLHHQLSKTPYQANRALALLSKMFSFAVSQGWRQDNPGKGIERYEEEKRDRWLNPDELKRFWEALNQYPNHLMAYLFKFLTLTGARKNEGMQATWDQFDLEEGIWVKPPHLTRGKKMVRLPLSNKTLEVLNQIKKLTDQNSPYVFPGRTHDQPIKGIETFWKTILKTAKLENFHIRDLRYTQASYLASSDISIPVIGRLLGYNTQIPTKRLSHLADEPLRQAAELFSRQVDEANSLEGV